MRITTIEDSFEYQVKYIMKEIKKDLVGNQIMGRGESLTDELLWKNKELLGELFYNRIFEAIGFESVGVIEEE